MNSRWFWEVGRSCGYSVPLNKATWTRALSICSLLCWDYAYLQKHYNLFLWGASVFSWSQPLSEHDGEWTGEVWMLLLLLLLFWAAIFHGSSWQTQSRLSNVSDGWRTEGWASRQLPQFWKWFFFFPLSRHANKLASKNVSLAFLIGEMFLRVGEKNDESFFSPHALRFVSLNRSFCERICSTHAAQTLHFVEC